MRIPHRVRHTHWVVQQWLLRQAIRVHAIGPFRVGLGRPAVGVYPALRSELELVDLLHKVKYYCDPNAVKSVEIALAFEPSFDVSNPAEWPVPTYSAEITVDEVVPVNVSTSPKGLWSALARFDVVFVWDWTFEERPRRVAQASSKLLNVDRHRYASEAWSWSEFAASTSGELDGPELAGSSRERLAAHLDALPSYGKAYVFGTGPSLDCAMDMDFSDGYRIVCNTIVENEALVRHIDPHVIVAGDAVYHYAPNVHATAFRRDLEKGLPKSDMIFVTRDIYHTLLTRHHPTIAKKTVVAESGVPGIHFNARERLVYHQWPMGNILNSLMLPIASSLADDIHLLGFDGRAPDDAYFWKTASKSSYDDLKPPMREAHPAFFATTDYERYAQAHSDTANKIMEAGESQGKRYVCLNQSYIPAFQSRMNEQPVSARV
jgi:hypothetical protein